MAKQAYLVAVGFVDRVFLVGQNGKKIASYSYSNPYIRVLDTTPGDFKLLAIFYSLLPLFSFELPLNQ